MINITDPQNSVKGALNQLQNDTENYMDLVTQGDVLNYDMLQLEVGETKESPEISSCFYFSIRCRIRFLQ